MQDINGILVISLSNIGDVILTLPVIGALRDNFPEAEISILVGIKASEVVKSNPEFSEVFVYDKHCSLKGKASFIKRLRKRKYDLIIDLRHSLFPLFLRAKYRRFIFFKRAGLNNEHRSQKHLRSLERLGMKPERIRFPFYISPAAEKAVLKMVSEKTNKEIVIINPTAASHLKCWEEERFILLAERIKGLSNYSIVVIGGKENREKCRRICREINGSVNLAGELNLQELAAFLKRAKIFITNDSGPLHLASALEVPTLAVFGPTDPVKYGPLSFPSRVVRKNLPCSPCELARCPRELQCMKLVSVEDVFNAFKEILDEERKS